MIVRMLNKRLEYWVKCFQLWEIKLMMRIYKAKLGLERNEWNKLLLVWVSKYFALDVTYEYEGIVTDRFMLTSPLLAHFGLQCSLRWWSKWSYKYWSWVRREERRSAFTIAMNTNGRPTPNQNGIGEHESDRCDGNGIFWHRYGSGGRWAFGWPHSGVRSSAFQCGRHSRVWRIR